MQKNKHLYNSNETHTKMKIEIPPNLSIIETRCFNEIVRPQLEELYSYDYDKVKYENISIHISKEVKVNIEKVKQILSRIPKKDLTFVSDIYFVSYKSKDETENYLVNGRTFPIIYKILVYPRAHEKLNIVLTHEIGHIIFEKKLSQALQMAFASEMIATFPQLLFWSKEKRDIFIKDEFANCYDNFINNKDHLKEFTRLYKFFLQYVI